MVRSLWSAATGMNAQQTFVDTIAHNLSNVNTTGYKTEVAEFKTLLYQNLQTRTTTANGEHKPVSAQVGLGVRNSAVTSIFRQGSMLESSSTSALGINGKGFFAVRGEDGNTYYTRNGNFIWNMDGANITLSTTDGLPVLDSNGNKISLPQNYIASHVVISTDGEVCYPDDNGNAAYTGVRIGLFQFQNPSGLEKLDGSLYETTAASGNAINENALPANLQRSVIRQGYLEGSNVQVADEMVNMIVAQRAYEMNSKVIQTTDDMMSQANNLRR